VSRSVNPDSSGRVPRSLVDDITLQHSCGMAAPLNHKDVVTRIRSEKIPAPIPDKDHGALPRYPVGEAQIFELRQASEPRADRPFEGARKNFAAIHGSDLCSCPAGIADAQPHLACSASRVRERDAQCFQVRQGPELLRQRAAQLCRMYRPVVASR